MRRETLHHWTGAASWPYLFYFIELITNTNRDHVFCKSKDQFFISPYNNSF